jgi:DNA/RNA-binding domain of Phe-tRNA-synthetase-like protein
MVTTETRRVLVVIYAPRGLDARALTNALNLTSSRMTEFAGGRETARFPGA